MKLKLREMLPEQVVEPPERGEEYGEHGEEDGAGYREQGFWPLGVSS